MFALLRKLTLFCCAQNWHFFLDRQKHHLKFSSAAVKSPFEYHASQSKCSNFHSNFSRKHEIALSKRNNDFTHESMIYDNKTKAAAWTDQTLRCRYFCGQMKHVCKAQCTFAALFHLGSISTKQTTFTCFKPSIDIMTIDKKAKRHVKRHSHSIQRIESGKIEFSILFKVEAKTHKQNNIKNRIRVSAVCINTDLHARHTQAHRLSFYAQSKSKNKTYAHDIFGAHVSHRRRVCSTHTWNTWDTKDRAKQSIPKPTCDRPIHRRKVIVSLDVDVCVKHKPFSKFQMNFVHVSTWHLFVVMS